MASGRKRSCTSQSSVDDGDLLTCPVCLELLSSVYATVCGHSFCYRCISRCLSRSPVCPVCKQSLPHPTSIHPNFTLNSVVAKYRQDQASIKVSSPKVQDVIGAIDKIDQKDYGELLSFFESFKQDCNEKAENVEHYVLLDFLECAAKEKARELETAKAHYQSLCTDINSIKGKNLPNPSPDLLERRKSRVHSNLGEFLDNYIRVRLPVPDTAQDTSLEEFAKTLKSYTSYSRWRELSSLCYGDPTTACSLVSSIDFDRDDEVFAVAGVTKKIKVFNYASILKNVGFHGHYPSHVMECEAKLSSISFNPYHKTTLASADYEGCVSVWDVNTCSKKASHHEHKKRVWSVVYNPIEPLLYASGSDDSTVKMWSANCQHSIFTLDTKANVCSVQFHPHNSFHFAFGSADHSIYYVDTRKPKVPLHQLKGHRKAVSYVQFISDSEVVSASIDSELKLWNTDTGQCLRTFKGHTNEKNFVGLTVSDNFIACGSEDNSVYVYSKQISTPMLTYKLNMSDTTNQETTHSTDFVSSVCWKKEQDIILAANSKGHIKLLELV